MKREAITHTKVKRLCRRLDFAQWQGVGPLESLWHLTARDRHAVNGRWRRHASPYSQEIHAARRS